jgi:AcrR family transcriptional regulator
MLGKPIGSRKEGRVPKIVDHDERRAGITEALWRVAAGEGLEAVSLARVAQEAGVSKGRVQHYFASRDDLLADAGRRLVVRVRGRVAERLAAAGPSLSPAEQVRVLLRAVLPLDDASRADARVRSAFLVRALGDPALVREYQEGNRLLLGAVTARLREHGAAEADALWEARLLVALVEGLETAVLLEEETAASAVALLDHQIGRAFRAA